MNDRVRECYALDKCVPAPADGLTAVDRRKGVYAEFALIRLFLAYPEFVNYLRKAERGR